jgi:hypothetical protein
MRLPGSRLAFLAIALSAGAQAQDVRVAVRAGTAASCALKDAAGAPADARLSGPTAGRWTWKRLPGDVLSCTSPGFEPLDLDPGRGALPAEITLEMLPARTVTLEASWAGLETAVEWRALVKGAPGTVLIARQSVLVGDRLTLPVAMRPRVLRLRPRGASPISLYLPEPEGSSPLTLRLPAPAPGGEVFGMLPAHAFTPAALEVTAGATTLTAEPDSRRVFRASGVRAGPATLVPRYRGGVRGKRRSLVIPPGQTVELLPLDLPEPGAVSLLAAPEVCAREFLPALLSLRRVAEGGGLEPAVVEQAVREPPCQRELEGLEEGTYEAALVRSGEKPEILASSRGHVFRGERLALALAAPEVRVSGRITFGEDRPAAGLSVRFELEEQTWTTQADENGEYAMSLGAEGEYGISVRTAAGLPSASFSRRFQKGAQRADFELAETTVSIRVGRSDGAPIEEEVQLALTSKAGQRLAAAWSPTSENETLFVGLDFGEYWVTGATPSGLASSSAERVDLTAEQPVAEVEIVLDRHDGRLKVVDEAGVPLPAEVLAGDRPLTPQGNGSFRLAGIAMGERLRVLAPGYVPVCRRLQPQDLPELRVVLPSPTDRLTLHFAADLPWGSGLLQGLPGSDCPIEITELEFAEQTGADRTTVVVRLPRGRFQFTMGAASYAVTPGRDAYIH